MTLSLEKPASYHGGALDGNFAHCRLRGDAPIDTPACCFGVPPCLCADAGRA